MHTHYTQLKVQPTRVAVTIRVYYICTHTTHNKPHTTHRTPLTTHHIPHTTHHAPHTTENEVLLKP